MFGLLLGLLIGIVVGVAFTALYVSRTEPRAVTVYASTTLDDVDVERIVTGVWDRQFRDPATGAPATAAALLARRPFVDIKMSAPEGGSSLKDVADIVDAHTRGKKRG